MTRMVLRADHVGSFLRPPELLDAAAAHAEQRMGDEELRAVQDAAILRALDLQRAAGLEVFTDGEYRRSWFGDGWRRAVTGLVGTDPGRFELTEWQGGDPEQARRALTAVHRPVAVAERVDRVGRMTDGECAFLREHAPGPVKVAMFSATGMAAVWYRPGITDRAYPTQEALSEALVEVQRQEVAALVEDGASYIQLDSLSYVMSFADPVRRAGLVAAGVDPEKLLGSLIAGDNATAGPALAAEGVTVGLHICRGNNRSAWAVAGGYEPVAERAFAELQVDRLLLEYDTERAGGFEPLRFVPAPKVAVLGLVSSKDPTLERQDELLRRVEAASAYIPVERLALSPQCGFASTAPGNLLSWDDQRRKLELVVETAARVWG